MSNGEVIRFELAWLPAFGLGFTLRLDGFAWMFGVLVTGIGFLVVLYARYYMSPADLGVDPAPRLKTLKVAEPPKRSAGIKVKTVQELVDKLKNEAKVI